MGDLWFCFKMLIITFVLVLLMQIRIGEHTLEASIHSWIQESPIVKPLDQVAQGGLKVLRQGFHGFSSKLSTKLEDHFSDDRTPGKRSLLPPLKRSQQVLNDLRKKAEVKVQEMTEGQQQGAYEWVDSQVEERITEDLRREEVLIE